MTKLTRIILLTAIFGLIFSCEKDNLESGDVKAPSPQLKTTTILNPGESIQAAVDLANPGDTLILSSGVYEKYVVVLNKDLTFIGEDGATVLRPNDALEFTILVGDCNVNLHNIIIDGQNGRFGSTAILYGNAGGEITNCTIRNGFYGITAGNWVEKPRKLKIRNNIIEDCAFEGIVVETTEPIYPFEKPNLDVDISQNQMFTDNVYPWYIHISLMGEGITGKVKSNEMQGLPEFLYSHAYGIFVQYSNSITIKDNSFYDVEYGIFVWDAENINIEKNIIEFNQPYQGISGIQCERLNGVSISRNRIEGFNFCIYACELENYSMKDNELDCAFGLHWCYPGEDVVKFPLSEKREQLYKLSRK